MIKKQLEGWNETATIDYYINHRQSYSDLYPSEKYFLTPSFITNITSFLDVGCASGSMSKILQSIHKNLKYTGLDIAPNLINHANQHLSNKLTDFYCYDGEEMPFEKEKFDLVFSSGVLHLIDNYKSIFTQIITRSTKYALVDFRVCTKQTYQGKFNFDFGNNNNVINHTSYHVINFLELMRFFKTFSTIRHIEAFGYKFSSSKMSEGIDEVYMIFFKFHIGFNTQNNPQITFHSDDLKNTFGSLL